MADLIAEGGYQVVVIDPLYLALLDKDTAGNASNVYAMGSVFVDLNEHIQGTGCTLIVAHHFKKSGVPDPEDPASLEMLAQAGVAEWARQWILLERREPYKSDGTHALWMRTGGSAGHAGLHGIDVNEGQWCPVNKCRSAWEITLRSEREIRDAADANEQAAKARKDEVEQAERRRRVVQVLKESTDAVTANAIKELARTSLTNARKILADLATEGRVTIQKKASGNGRETEYFTPTEHLK